MRKWILFSVVLALVVLVVDQWTKVLIERSFLLGESLPVLPCFALTYVRNQGAAWGMFQGFHYVLAGIGIVAILVCLCFWRALFGTSRWTYPIGGLLFSGIIGNLIDRIRLSYVVDFLDFHWGDAHFPCFNIADSAICVAVFLLLILQWRTKES
ncbi:MAG: signal peptidase II [Kiritimatiellae bacterium]|nr:signal peptidase II [Kiritimatiellia bacterium]